MSNERDETVALLRRHRDGFDAIDPEAWLAEYEALCGSVSEDAQVSGHEREVLHEELEALAELSPGAQCVAIRRLVVSALDAGAFWDGAYERVRVVVGACVEAAQEITSNET